MFWRKQKPRVETHTQTTIRFVGEQDGEPERLLKNSLVEEFRSTPDLRRAYLAQVAYQNSETGEVALCLSGPENQRLVGRIGTRFAKIFGKDVHLDILFLSSQQEAELERVCTPFYRAPIG